ncbi:MAG: hypothetical protein IT206_02900 [Fimbriimonadaceae bacterium]|nr:hypothetical protein [Fimbriimonadaceae bacterium]
MLNSASRCLRVTQETRPLGSAYTPGLTVSGNTTVRRPRRLPIKGQVKVQVGDAVGPRDVVASASLPGILQTIKLGEKLGLEPKEARALFMYKVGDHIDKGEMVAESKGFFGLFKTTVKSDYSGTVEAISDVSGHVLLRQEPIPVDLTAYISGKVAEIMPEEGAVIETRGAMVQGIFGIGGEQEGEIRVAVKDHSQPLAASDILDTDTGKILVGGSQVTLDAIRRAEEVGVVGLIAGGVLDSDLIEVLGYDIGVAITGQEALPVTIMVTEGFGRLNMAERTFKLLQTLQGKKASMNGATQIRAGVIRPEIIVPLDLGAGEAHEVSGALELKAGTPIRIIREPYFGALGAVTELPSQLVVLESGTEVRVLRAKLESGEEVTVPRANVEIIAT